MQTVIRAAVVYLFLMIVFRIAGRRTLTDLSTFDLVLLLIISESTQPALTGDNYSVTNAALAILTLVGLDIMFSLVKVRFKAIDRWMDGAPLVIVRDGRPLRDRMKRARVDEDDVLSAARLGAGVGRLEEIAYAVLETNGEISVIPRRAGPAGGEDTGDPGRGRGASGSAGPR